VLDGTFEDNKTRPQQNTNYNNVTTLFY